MKITTGVLTYPSAMLGVFRFMNDHRLSLLVWSYSCERALFRLNEPWVLRDFIYFVDITFHFSRFVNILIFNYKHVIFFVLYKIIRPYHVMPDRTKIYHTVPYDTIWYIRFHTGKFTQISIPRIGVQYLHHSWYA